MSSPDPAPSFRNRPWRVLGLSWLHPHCYRMLGVHRAFGLAVLTATRTGIARIVVFGDPGLVTRWGFPPVP